MAAQHTIPLMEVHSNQTPVLEINKTTENNCNNRDHALLGIRDAMELLSGKWKIEIIGSLMFGGKMRFMDVLRHVDGIAAKMLSKELQDLEQNQLVIRTVMDTKPVTVEYEITEYAKTLEPLIKSIANWGLDHRKRIMR